MRVAGGTAHGRGPERGYGREHRELRKRFGLVVAVGAAVCARCGRFIDPREPSDLGHDDLDRSRYTGPKHRRCNRATAGRARRRIASRAWCRTRTSRRSSWTTGTSTSEPYEPPTAPRHANGPSVAFNHSSLKSGLGRRATRADVGLVGVARCEVGRGSARTVPKRRAGQRGGCTNRAAVGAAHRVARQCRGRAAPPLALTALGDRPYDRHDPAP